CCIWARSMTARKPRGAERSKRSTRLARTRGRSRCSPRTARRQFWIAMWCMSGLSGSRLHRPRQWGACWLACHLWDQLRLDDFWSTRQPASRQGTRLLNVLKTLVTYRLVDPGSEWRLHRQWYAQNAIGDLLGEDFAVAGKDNLYRCLDKLLAHKQELFSFLRQ